MIILKKAWKKFINYAYEQSTQALPSHEKFKYLISVIDPEVFKRLNIYDPDQPMVIGFSKNIVESNSLLREVIEKSKSQSLISQTFSSFSTYEIPAYQFFTDNGNFLVDISEPIKETLLCLNEIFAIYNEQENLVVKDTSAVTYNRNFSTLQLNTDILLAFVESLYSLYKKLL